MSIITDIAAGTTGGILGGVGQLAKDIREAITGDIPADKKAEIEHKLMEIELQSMQAQTKINEIEAANEHIFVSGWRPFIGWCGGIALLYASIIEPLMTWIAKVNGNTQTLPHVDTSILVNILMAILGVGVMRSFDKMQDPAPKGKE